MEGGHPLNIALRFLKKSYGFDTVSGLPEDWVVGDYVEKKCCYSSDKNVPKINSMFSKKANPPLLKSRYPINKAVNKRLENTH